MSGPHRTCVICGIKERHSSEKLLFARFPLDRNRCAEWVKAVGNNDLAYLSIEKLNGLRHVCEKHFSKKDFTKTKTRLKKRAIPKLNLMSPPLADNIIAEFLQINSHEYTVYNEHNYFFGLEDNDKSKSEDPILRKDTKHEHVKIIDNLTFSDIADDRVQSEVDAPEPKVQDGPFTWQKQSIICAEDEDIVDEDELLLTHKPNGEIERAMVKDLETAVESEEYEVNAPEPEVQDVPFTWQKQTIICAEDEDIVNVNELPSKYKPNNVIERAMLKDLETSMESEEHGGYRCNECGGDIVGVRYVCVQCEDYHVCSPCEVQGVHALHYALRVPQEKHTDEVRRVIETIRKCISDDPSIILLPASETVKIEVENEEEDQVMESVCEPDPLTLPPAQSAESCWRVPDMQPHPASGEHTAPLSRDVYKGNIVYREFVLNAFNTRESNKLEVLRQQSRTRLALSKEKETKPNVKLKITKILAKPLTIMKHRDAVKLKKLSVNLKRLENVK